MTPAQFSPRYYLIAAAIMHVEGFYSVKSRAFMNKNPGNLEHPGGAFRVFPTIQTGFNALVEDVAANQGKTLRAFLYKYAPPSENDSAMYLSVVSSLTEINPDGLI